MPKEYRFAGERNKSIGFNTTTIGIDSVAIGLNAATIEERSVAIGSAAYAQGYRSIAIGYDAYAQGSASIAIGMDCEAAPISIAIGEAADAGGLYSVAIGNNARAPADNVTVINASGDTFPAHGVVQKSNVYISNIFNLNGTSTGNLFTSPGAGGRLYGAMYCNVQTGHICVIAQ